MKNFLIIATILTSLVSCTVTKRIHNSGFHVQWNSNHKKVNSNNNANAFQSSEEKKVSEEAFETTELTIEYSLTIQTSEEIVDVIPIEKQIDEPLSESRVEFSDKEEYSVLKSVSKKLQTIKYHSIAEKKDREVRIDWDTVGFVALLIILGTLVVLALFATSPFAQIAAITLAVLGLAMIIAAACLIGWFFWFIFFGWWM